MSTDPEQIRAAARIVSGLASRARAASVAVTGAGHARWESLGAQRFRTQLGMQRGAFLRCAGALEDLSTLLLNHALHVESHEAALAKAALAVTNTAQTVVDDARRTVHDAATVARDARHVWDDTGGSVLHTVSPPW
ncbi:hypothetical protein [Allobranchiibius huperziae]|uniref:Methyl-accepting chemotaxis protein n=1 Tax=Allobranchiibius huperziae TaxID=1874116 RepID=A0A853DGA4_9MICO|nr:hypothetical protein [Allobranchiibius huperziae]NYJ73255.1 methyl-accepting chemotaxis protein [Allobranchiibius huperziae]